MRKRFVKSKLSPGRLKANPICLYKTCSNENDPSGHEAHGPLKVNPALTVLKVRSSGLLPSRDRPGHRPCSSAVDLPMSGAPDRAAPWLRFLVAVRLRLRSISVVSEASGVSHSPRAGPGSPLGGHAQGPLSLPSWPYRPGLRSLLMATAALA